MLLHTLLKSFHNIQNPTETSLDTEICIKHCLVIFQK